MMRYSFDNDLHIHSKISLCSSDAEQTNKRILQYAKQNNLKTICLTDHFWDENVEFCEENQWYAEQNFEHISAAKPLPQADGIDFLFGCETEMDYNMNLGIGRETFERFDFVVVPTTHFHITGFTIPADLKTPAEKGVGIELNSDDMKFEDEESDIILKPHRIAKNVVANFTWEAMPIIQRDLTMQKKFLKER